MSGVRRLLLMRHAKSDWSFEEPDHDRPLNARGRRSADALGAWLRDSGMLPDQVLCSTSRRTRETLERLDIDAPVRFEDRLYHAAPEAVLDALRGAEGSRVLIIGHNPGFQETAARLVRAAPTHPRFGDYPTGATLVARFALDDWRDAVWGMADPEDFVIPRELLDA
ncbi:Histidine phosphatase superfamily (branch 1) [Roseivivax jejudonensis]|uniref:Histidine phosphatase superfamily (Branch 1) n=1 Tax=Roseivivax jejudonensis TaxID=1529041 RepID=A0A1X6YE42_9RHOB|nr:histidine phosphatase family protein [Roseivivax jejudonensis]SLN18217.1 Histidine phosphatase superfamily (branch 1) [Roseivivax jejudonensis]